MHEIQGVLHDGSTSRSRPATLCVYADGTVRLRSADGEQALAVGALGIPARLGNTARRISLPDGGEFETDDNAGVDALLDRHGPARHDWLHRLENRIPVVVFATLLVLVCGALFALYGVPALAHRAAFAVSPEWSARLGDGTLEVLDRALGPSALDEARRETLRRRLRGITEQAGDDFRFELLFRSGGTIGANAFALPSGTLLLTDELVALAEHDDEVVAVLAHEVGHVVNRHGLRQAIQSSMLALAIVLVSGDLSSSSGFVAALPTALAQSHFSRDFEREADDYALSFLLAHGIEPKRFADLLLRLEAASGGSAPVPFLSSHPATQERIERLRSAAPR